MAIRYFELPLYNDTYYSYSVPLEGNTYTLEFLYLERLDSWLLSLITSDGQVLVRNQRLSPEVLLFIDYALPNLSGGFYLESVGLPSSDNKFRNIKDFYKFYYIYDDGE